MDFKFYLINESSGVQTEIEEPVGFDNFKPILRRDSKFHGVNFEFSEQNLGFYGKAYKLVTDVYNTFGIDGVLIFLVEYNCNGAWQEFYRGALDYKRYEEVKGDGCIVNVGIAQLGVPMTLKNRMETKVDLDTLSGFEGATLPAYSNLGKTMSIPSKGILLMNSEKLERNVSSEQTNGSSFSGNKKYEYHIYKVPFGKATSEFDTLDSEEAIRYGGDLDIVNGNKNYSKAAESAIFVNGTNKEATFNIELKTVITVFAQFTSNTSPVEFQEFDAWFTVSIFDNNNVMVGNHLLRRSIKTLNTLTYFTINLDTSVLLKPGYKIAAYVEAYRIVYTSDGQNYYGQNRGFLILVLTAYDSQDTYLKISYLDKTAPTTSKIYMLHEALSRTAEVTTNNSLTVKSNYYGRKDSQINPTQADGVGSLRCLTNGYFLRQAKLTSGEPNLFISFKDLLDGLNAIDAIGYSVEDDKLRIEPWEYFYTDNVILRCHDISEVKRKIDVNRCFSLFDIGYNKWESGTWESIDGFHGKRQYRTKLKNIDTKSEQFCKFIADSYAIEETKRKSILTAKDKDDVLDWRYDNDTFIIDLIRDASSAIIVTVGTGDNNTLIDPGTVFNVDLSPSRMAARWFGWVMQAMRVKRLAIGGTYRITPGQCIQCGNCYSDYPNAFINGGSSALFVGGVTEITPTDANLEQDIQGGIEVCPVGAIAVTDEGMVIEGADELIFTGAEGYADAITTSKHAGSVANGEVLERQNWNAGKIINRNPIPKFKPELVEFEYPLTAAEFIAIRNNPHGLIEFNGEYGWIREIEADLLEGIAKFTLIPKR
jgi:ferredoxin